MMPLYGINEPDMAPLSREETKPSSFFYTPTITTPDTLAILHLKRDSLLPVTLRSAGDDDGYSEGTVTNTRFGSFPHSTLIGIAWGSQVRASKVDTGTRGRRIKKSEQQQLSAGSTTNDVEESASNEKKRKPNGISTLPQSPTKKLKQAPERHEQAPGQTKEPVNAGSGFVHILQPTPEAWTSSLDHRTQVVYCPDYSYILQRLRVRPGSTIIEAGAGSGSFTHAAARAVFNGYPLDAPPNKARRKSGRVYSYEFHEPRVQSLREELHNHGLDGVVQLTYRDVCNDGFALPDGNPPPEADAVFLDLPAPWVALKHLTRMLPSLPLNPTTPVQLCTFSPCIEQVTATVSYLRKNDWTEIQMVEVASKRIDVRRERVGLKEEGLRGVNASAATVNEAVTRLREVESKLSDFHSNKAISNGKTAGQAKQIQSKAERLEKVKAEAESRKLYKEGNLVQRTEPEVKTHTSYLVFATLPRECNEEGERACSEQRSDDKAVE